MFEIIFKYALAVQSSKLEHSYINFMFEIFIAILFLRYENGFVVTGLVLPNPSEDRAVHQMQLLDTVKSFLAKLSPTLSEHEIKYVRVLKGPAPSILEV